MQVLPDETVNSAMEYDPVLAGTNSFWGEGVCGSREGAELLTGDRGGQNVKDPAPWSNNEVQLPAVVDSPADSWQPMTIAEYTDGDYVPYR